MSKITVETLINDIKESGDFEEFSKINDKELTDEEKISIINEFNNHIMDGINTPCKIVLNKGKSGITNIKIDCKSRIALLITLVGAIESIRKEHNIDQFEWDLFTMAIGYEKTD